jgi:hypothetical protein
MKRNKQLVFQSFSGTKRYKPNYSITFQDIKGTNQFVLKLFKIEGEGTETVQKDQCNKKEIHPKLVPNGNPKLGR